MIYTFPFTDSITSFYFHIVSIDRIIRFCATNLKNKKIIDFDIDKSMVLIPRRYIKSRFSHSITTNGTDTTFAHAIKYINHFRYYGLLCALCMFFFFFHSLVSFGLRSCKWSIYACAKWCLFFYVMRFLFCFLSIEYFFLGFC